MIGFEAAEEVHAKAAGLVRHLAPVTFRRWEVAFPLDGRGFHGAGPGSKLPGTGLGQLSDFLQVPEVRLESGPVLDYRHHGAHLATGAACNGEEGEQLIRGNALEAFGDVVGNGERSAVELVAEAGRERDAGFFEQIEHAVIEPGCLFSNGQSFELRVFGHVEFLLSTVSGRLLAIGYWLLLTIDQQFRPRLYAPPSFRGTRKAKRAGFTTGKPARSGGTNDTR